MSVAPASSSGPVGGKPMELFMTDNCPFAQRTWIGLLEKEEDPFHPKLFNFRNTNYFNLDLPNTREFYLVHNTVPCGILPDGTHLKESMPMVIWADETYPHRNPLGTKDEKVKAVQAKFTSGEFDTTMPMFQTMMAPNDEARKAPLAKLMRSLAELSKDVQAGGPFLAGENFSAADIAVYPFVERARIYLPEFAKTPFPSGDEYKGLHSWLAACESRPSVKISCADRTEDSMKCYPFAQRERKAYLIETFAPIAANVKEQCRRQLRFSPAGQASYDIPKAIETKKAEEDSMARVKAGNGTAADLALFWAMTLFDKDQKVLLIADDQIRWELPYGTSLHFPPSFDGKDAFKSLVTMIQSNFSDVRVHTVKVQSVNDNESWSTYSVLGKRAKDGTEFRNDFVLYVKSEKGKIVLGREYFDPTGFKREGQQAK